MVNRFQWVRNMSVGKVLEIGCADSFTFLGVDDVDWTGIDMELKPEWEERLKGRDFRIMDGYETQYHFSSASIDTIVLAEVLEHVEDPIGLIDVNAPLLKIGGRMVITIPDEWNWAPECKPFENKDHIHHFKQEDIDYILFTMSPSLEVRQLIHTPIGWNMGFVFWYILLERVK